MKKIIYILSFVLLLTACGRTIVLKKSTVLKAPYNEKVLPAGNYEITLYKINYPNSLEDRQKFLNELNVLLKKFYLSNKKASILIDKNFYNDLKLLKKDYLLEDEKVFDKPASFLTEIEINYLISISEGRIEKFRDTTQEYLNFQIEYLLKYLGRKKEFNPEKVYSEREKSDLVDELKSRRKENVNLLDSLGIELVLEIDNPYTSNIKNLYWDNREVILKNSNNFNNELNNKEIPIYVKGIKKEDIDSILKEEYKINSKAILLENDFYEGYKNLETGYIFLVGGNKLIKSYDNYNFGIKIKELELEDMLNIKKNIMIGDIIGGKK